MGSEWIDTTVGDFCPFTYGKGLPESKRNLLGNIAVYGSNGIVRKHDVPFVDSAGIIIGRKGTVGAVHYSDKPFWPIDTTFFVSDEPRKRDLRFTYYLLKGLGLEQMNSDSAVPGLNRDATHLKSILVPPLPEQHRIVAKLEKLLTKVETCKERLEKIPALLKRFRQSVLAAACSGRLTVDWRKKNPSVENVAATIDAIRRRREAEAKTSAQKERLREIFETLEENDSRDLPDGWRFVALSKLCNPFDYGTSAKSQPSGKIPVLRMGNIQNGKIDWKDLVYTSDDSEIQKYLLQPNTVLFNRTNSPELVGKPAIYRGERPAIFSGYLIRVNQLPELEPNYLNLCLNMNYAKEFCLRVKTDGVSQSNINAQKLGAFEVPFCPLSEQQEIVRRVEALFKIAAHIEERYKKAKTYVQKLTQSVLTKAFRGELVPQDPNDEPVSVLLKRIRQEREKRWINLPKSAI